LFFVDLEAAMYYHQYYSNMDPMYANYYQQQYYGMPDPSAQSSGTGGGNDGGNSSANYYDFSNHGYGQTTKHPTQKDA
jgi:hypothetical protein